MLDNCTIKSWDYWMFSHLTPRFFSTRKETFERYYSPFRYKIWNGEIQRKGCYLTVEAYNVGKKSLRIVGSLRKWYYGEDSLADLTRKDFICAIKLLSEKLQIPFDEFLKFDFYKVEIGRNIRLKVPVASFLSLVAGFSSNSYILRQEIGWRHFRTYRFKATLYDKIKEIKKKSKKGLIKELEEIHQPIEELNVLRVEFTIMRGKAELQKKLGYSTIYDFVENYRDLYVFFWMNCQEFQLLEDFPIDRIPKSNSWGALKNVVFEEAARNMGYDRMMELCSYLDGKVKRDANLKLRELFNINTGKYVWGNKHFLLRAIRVEMLIHFIKSGWARESSKYIPVINYNI